MRVPQDIHTDDTAARDVLAATLIDTRKALGLSTYDLDAADGRCKNSAWQREHRRSWETATVQRWARLVGRRLELVIHGLTVPDDDDIMAVVYDAADRSTPLRADRAHLREVCNNLVRVRHDQGVTAVEMGRRLSVTENAVHYWDANPDGTSIISVQRYARALTDDHTSSIGLELHESATAVVPAQRRAVAA